MTTPYPEGHSRPHTGMAQGDTFRRNRTFSFLSKDNFTGSTVRSDITAGVIVAMLLIPQSMGYALIAGLPPATGLYAATLPLIAYALLGSSRQLSVGPVAMASLIVFSICSKFHSPGTPEYIAAATMVAGLSGVMLLLMGILRAGSIVNFVSDTVIHGFTAAAAVIIMLSQLRQLFGISITESPVPLLTLWHTVIALPSLSLPTTLLGICGVALLLIDRYFIKKRIGPFILIIFGIMIVYLFRLDLNGVRILGEIPGGLPPFSLHVPDPHAMVNLLPGTFSLSLVGFLESIAVAKIIADKRGYRINPNRELVGLGAANIAAYLFSGYAVTGGFSRSVVNDSAGAKTPLASVITALLILCILLFFTRTFYYLPAAVLAAIVIVAVANLMHFSEGFRLFRLNKPDGITYFLTFLVTLGIGIEPGIITGIIFSLLVFLWRSAHPHIIEVPSPPHASLPNASPVDLAKTETGEIRLKIVGPLFFATMRYLEDYFEERYNAIITAGVLRIDFSGVFCMDAVALRRLEKQIDLFNDRNIEVTLLNANESIRTLGLRAGWNQKQWGAALFGDDSTKKVGYPLKYT